MANRYFVLATGDNNISSTGTWSANSNGSPTGASVPTSADAVFPSTSIGSSANLKMNASLFCLSMDWTGVTNKPSLTANYSIVAYGSVTFVSTSLMTITSWTGQVGFYLTSGTATLISAGQALNNIAINGAGGTTQLGDNLSCAGFVYTNGNWNTNGKTFTVAGSISLNPTSGTQTITISGSTVTCTTWQLVTTHCTFITDSSSKIITNGSIFYGGDATNYQEVDLNYAGTTTITGSNTFANLVLPSGTTQTIQFTDGTTQHVAACSLNGDATHQHTLTGTSTAGWNLVKDGGGTVTVSYCTISYSVASPATTWYYDGTCTYNGTSGWTSSAPVGWTHIVKFDGVSTTSIGKINTCATSTIAKVNGIAV